MKICTIKKLFAVTLLCFAACSAIHAGGHRIRNGNVPVGFSVSPSSPSPNSGVTMTVQLDAVTPNDQAVAIGCTQGSAFTNLPSEVTVSAGHSSATFSATTSGSFDGSAAITATCNSVSYLFTFPQ